MADIDIQKKKSSGGKGWIWGLVLAAGAIALVLFFIFNGEANDPEVGAAVELDEASVEGPWEPMEDETGEAGDTAAPEAEGQQAQQQEGDQQEAFPIAAIMNAPNDWDGRTVDGEVTVREVPTDRGFWVEEDGQRAFFVVDPEGRESDAHIQQGQRLRISGAKVYLSANEITGRLVPEARQAVQNQPAFFVVDPEDFEIL